MGLEQAVYRYPIEELLQGQGFAPLNAEEWIGQCPVCSKEKLCVNVLKRTWHCWVCQGAGSTQRQFGRGGLLALFGWLFQWTPQQAAAHVLEKSGRAYEVHHVDGKLKTTQQRREEVAVIEVPPPVGWEPIYAPLPYLIERGITMDDVASFGLLHTTSGPLAHRLVFPVWNGGRLVYWQARAMWSVSEQPTGRYIKVLNPPRAVAPHGAGAVLYNLDTARHYPRVAIVEGPIDAVRTGPDAVATLGKHLTERQLGLLLQAGVRAVDLMWDGPSPTEPEGAWPEMAATVPRLAPHFDVRLVFLPRGDPADHTRADLSALRACAPPVRPRILELR